MGSEAREGAEAMSLAFVLLDFQHVGVRRRVECMRWSVDMQQFREVSRTRTIYSTETQCLCNVPTDWLVRWFVNINFCCTTTRLKIK